MEDYIFLIIAIALSIFGVINQSKKKKEAENPFQETDVKPRNFFMDQLLGKDFLAEPEKKKAQPVKVKKPVYSSVPAKSSSNIQKIENYQLPRFKSTLPDRPKHVTVSTMRRQAEEEEIVAIENEISYLEDFSLRKAFVYSKIMERKYF
jgi:hypothetical protein